LSQNRNPPKYFQDLPKPLPAGYSGILPKSEKVYPNIRLYRSARSADKNKGAKKDKKTACCQTLSWLSRRPRLSWDYAPESDGAAVMRPKECRASQGIETVPKARWAWLHFDWNQTQKEITIYLFGQACGKSRGRKRPKASRKDARELRVCSGLSLCTCYTSSQETAESLPIRRQKPQNLKTTKFKSWRRVRRWTHQTDSDDLKADGHRHWSRSPAWTRINAD